VFDKRSNPEFRFNLDPAVVEGPGYPYVVHRYQVFLAIVSFFLLQLLGNNFWIDLLFFVCLDVCG
jgi:hypothetical protein